MEPIPEGARKGLAVFAHPDDESLWCGGLIARGDVDWTVVCCSIPYRDPERASKFFKACGVLGATPVLLPYSERDGLFRIEEISTADFDVVLTHGAAGEYGHPQHRELHERLPATLHIGYRPNGVGRFLVPLDEELRAKKLAALKCYDHISMLDSKPKWEALIDYYGKRFDLWCETYD